MNPQSFSTFTELLRARVADHPAKPAYTFLDGTDQFGLSYEDLDRDVRRYASVLQAHGLAGERVILVFPVGPAFMYAFYACLYTGAVAIPSSEPRQQKVAQSDLQRLLSIIHDSRPKAILTTASIRDAMQGPLQDQLPSTPITWLTEAELGAGDPELWRPVNLKKGGLTFLQYTSGSTGSPKGVMVSHENLLANQAMLANLLGNGPDTVIVSWLPLFHDMGLICKMLQATYLGVPAIHMPPSTFIRQPYLWLKAMTDHGGTFSGGPNFAYDLCVQRVNESRRAKLDLSRWRVAMNGSEPVRHSTQQAFIEAFADCGFHPKAFNPCYGLAEATVFVSGYPNLRGHGVAFLDEAALGQGDVVETEQHGSAATIVGSGLPVQGETLSIVDPGTREPVGAGKVGEIWVQGAHIATGYWEKPEISEAVFNAKIAGRENEAGFLRTGDLGFIRDGELFFTGRLKELIIVHGVNHYPQDIERTVEETHEALRPHCGAAFSVDVDGEEKLVVVYEVLRKFRNLDFEPVFERLRTSIRDVHDLAVHAIVIIQPKTMPKTTSGKLQRRSCRSQYLEDQLQVVAKWEAAILEPRPQIQERAATPSLQETMQRQILQALANTTQRAVASLDAAASFADYGLDSVRAATLMGSLSDSLGRELSPTLVYDFPNTAKLAAHLSERLKDDPARQTAIEAVDRGTRSSKEPIAVVGMACRFPGAKDLDGYWSLLAEGRDAITEIPESRWDWQRFFQPGSPVQGKTRTRWGGFLEDVDRFDGDFFGIAPREAEQMDPQQRLLLEVTWEALEHAGIDPSRLAHTATGVYVGISNNDYSRFAANHADAQSGHAGTGNAFSIAANRLSYFLNLRGPSLAIDTACSSSLVSIHQACQAIWHGESDMALAGGVNLILHPDMTLVLSHAGMMSPTGRCRTFAADADGYVRGEGCGMLVLKPLCRAQADGDRIHAVIRATAVNQDGHSNGLTAPNGPAQEAVIRQALNQAAVDAGEVGYVETHGSGTSLGDPIEVNALKRVLGDGGPQRQNCDLGAVKTQIGHLEAAAGIAGFIKAALVLERQFIPGNLHQAKPNPLIDLSGGRLQIPTAGRQLPSEQPLHFAGVSSFGFGGTNAHIILEKAPQQASTPEKQPGHLAHLLPVSGKTPQALFDQTASFRSALEATSDEAWRPFCLTAGDGRKHHTFRKAFAAPDRGAMLSAMDAWMARHRDDLEGHAVPQNPPAPVFLFTGQGSQYPGMARALYDSEPFFQQYLDEAIDHLEPHLDQPLRPLLLSAEDGDTRIHQTGNAQPALFAYEYALCQTWRHWGVEPAALMGHSVGEYVAAVLAGVFDLASGCRLIAARAKLMQALPEGGAMMVCFAPRGQIEPLIDGLENVAFAAFNAPNQTVVSGAKPGLATLKARLDGERVRTHELQVSHAFHSPLMTPMLEAFSEIANAVTYRSPQKPLFSNLTGAMATHSMASPDYWVRHISEPVRFQQGLTAMARAGYDTFLEIGPKPSLTGLAKIVLEVSQPTCLASTRTGEAPRQTMLTSLAKLYEMGQPIRWQAVAHGPDTRIDLPHYPWQRHRYWLPDLPSQASPVNAGNPWIGRQIAALAHLPGHTVFEVDLDLNRLPFLETHQAFGRVALPVAGFAAMIVRAGRALDSARLRQIEALEIKQPLFLERGQPRKLQIAVMPDLGDTLTVQILADSEGAWHLHASARLVAPNQTGQDQLQLGLMFFASSQDTGQAGRKYQLVIDAAKFGDEQGFSSIWVPERHFTKLGCLYPNPAILQAGLALATSRIRLQAGSVVLPIHHPMRIAEEWAMVDNLSAGRVGISAASGWNPDDFIFFPDRYQERRDVLFEQLEKVRRLWRGGSLLERNGIGKDVEVFLQPKPIQSELPVWVTAAGNPKTFEMAGALGAHLLTHLLDQGVDALAEKIAIYRKARADHGFDPEEGIVTVMLHTFVGEDADSVRDYVKPAYCGYLKNNIGLLRGLAHSRGSDVDITKLPEKDLEDFVGFLFDRFATARGLIGSPESCLPLLEEMDRIGVDEIACLLDIGPREDEILAHLPYLNQLKALYAKQNTKSQAVVQGPDLALANLQAQAQSLSGSAFYDGFQTTPFKLEGVWRGVKKLWLKDREALGQVVLEGTAPEQTEDLQPVLLEACTHCLLAAIADVHDGKVTHFPKLMPSGWEGYLQWRPLPEKVWSHAILRGETDGEGCLGDIYIYEEDGAPVAKITGLRLTTLTHQQAENAAPSQFYTLAWEPHGQATNEPEPGEYLIFGDPQSGQHKHLSKKLGGNDPIIWVKPGSEFTGENTNRFTIDPLDRSHFDKLLDRTLGQAHRQFKGILFLWPLETSTQGIVETRDLIRSQIPVVGAGLQLLQALAERRAQGLPPTWLVTRGAQPVAGETHLIPAQATLWGLARVASFEYPELPLHLVDCDPDSDLATASEALLSCLNGKARHNQWAIRGNQSYTATLTHQSLQPAASPKPILPNHTYWITGGLGGLGLALAQWLVDRGATQLLLSGRRPPSDAANAQIKAWTAKGVEVATALGDISGAGHLGEVFARFGADLPPLKGIFHLAGLPDTQMLFQQDWAQIQKVRAAKVEGSFLLHKLSENMDLDHFVMFSSAAALLTLSGQSNYASASTFMDVLAHQRQKQGLPGVSINWGPWGEVGHAALAHMQKSYQRFDELGMQRIAPEAGMAILGQILESSEAQAGVIPVDWARFFNHDLQIGQAPVLAALRQTHGAEASSEHASEWFETLRAMAPKPRLQQIQEKLRGLVMRVLKLAEAPTGQRGFFDMGMDSLMALDLRSKLQAELGFSLPSTLVFEQPSIDAMSAFLAANYFEGVPTQPDQATRAAEDADQTASMKDLSQDELAALIDQELETLLP